MSLLEAFRRIADGCPDCDVDEDGPAPRLVLCAHHDSEARGARERAAEESRRAVFERAAEEKWRNSGVPEYLAGWSFDKLDKHDDRTAALRTCRAWGEGLVNAVVMTGPVGAGKSSVAAAAARLRCREHRVRWLSGTDLSRALRGSYQSPERARVEQLCDGREALVLDDADKALGAKGAAQVIYELVERRAEGSAPLLMTTNMDLGELGEALGGGYTQPFLSRMQLVQRVRLTTPDLRVP